MFTKFLEEQLSLQTQDIDRLFEMICHVINHHGMRQHGVQIHFAWCFSGLSLTFTPMVHEAGIPVAFGTVTR